MRWLMLVVVAGCGFAPRPAQPDDGGLTIDAPDGAVLPGLDPPWWDPGWSSRHRLAITTGNVRPGPS